MQALAEELRAIGRNAGLDAVGIASAEPFEDTRQILEQRKRDGLHGGMQFTYRRPERSTDPANALPGAKALVVGARWYGRRAAAGPAPGEPAEGPGDPAAGPGDPTGQPTLDPAGPSGRVAKYARADHYTRLREALGHIAEALTEAGWQAKVLVDDNALVDRAAAHRAGLGWFGKNTNLLLPGAGSEFVLGSVVTDAPLQTDTATPMADGCGPCTRCITACPTGALVAPGVLDARRCLAWLVQQQGVFPPAYREALGDRIYGCDDCQDACPPNRVNLRRRSDGANGVSDQDQDDGEAMVPLLDILETADDAALLERYGRWYIPERQARYLKRNALVALGNVGDGQDARTAKAVADALRHRDPLVRAHAVWAASRLGRRDLLAPINDDPDPDVQAELGALPPPRRA